MIIKLITVVATVDAVVVTVEAVVITVEAVVATVEEVVPSPYATSLVANLVCILCKNRNEN